MAAEQAITFACGAETLVGVLARPADRPEQTTAVLVVVGGPQYRAGSHRQFTVLARTLAQAGWPTLRFDYRGMGDSTGDARSFESVSDDIGAAITALQQHVPQLQRVVLWGLCDGASASLIYLHQRPDPRVGGLCLANPWVRSTQSLARTHVKHYYTRRLMEPAFWRKLARGGVGAKALRDLAGTLRALLAPARAPAAVSAASPKPTGSGASARPTPAADFREAMRQAAAAFTGPTLLTLSGDDYTAKEFSDHAGAHPQWRELLAQDRVQHLPLPDADHTFSDLSQERLLLEHTVAWLERVGAPAASAPPVNA